MKRLGDYDSEFNGWFRIRPSGFGHVTREQFPKGRLKDVEAGQVAARASEALHQTIENRVAAGPRSCTARSAPSRHRGRLSSASKLGFLHQAPELVATKSSARQARK